MIKVFNKRTLITRMHQSENNPDRLHFGVNVEIIAIFIAEHVRKKKDYPNILRVKTENERKKTASITAAGAFLHHPMRLSFACPIPLLI
jgi:hypothetical protein